MIDTREIKRQGPSYTILSLEELRAEYGKQIPLTWILGEDAFQEFENWHRYQDILSLAHLIILARPQLKKNFSKSLAVFIEKHLTDNPEDLIQATQGKIYFYRSSNYPISSSQIREDIHHHILPQGLAPKILEYIQEHACYQRKLKD
jgi:nicotinate-nucleotide adenylyltransferase